ncbi:uncharacterized protein [Oscarella lobularis]|uniref:uncharacterized protein n=1 Tax=Oscarella lobularis TaxID=121494 RepID=UPI0033139140
MDTHLPSESIAKTAATKEESTKNDSAPKNAEAGSTKSREDNEKIPFDVREKPSRLGPEFSFYGPPNAIATTTPLVDATLGNVKKGDLVVETRKPPSSAVAENDCDQVGSSVDKTLGNLEKGEAEGGEGCGRKVDETKESRTSKGKSKRSKRSKDSKSSSPPRHRRPVPTHFVGIRVSEATHIVDEIRSAQKSVVEQNGNLERAVVPVETMHVTLTVLSLNNDEEVENDSLCSYPFSCSITAERNMKSLAFCLFLAVSTVANAQSLVDPEDPCRGAQCPELQCRRVKRVEGKCCPECEDPCLTTECPEFTRCETDALKTRAICMETCENNGKCGRNGVCQLETTNTCLGGGRDLCIKRATCKPGCPDLPRSFVQDACFGCGCTKECENKGKNVCIPTYDRSFVCTCRDWGAKWSNGGPIEGMKCTNIREPLNATNQYLCLPISTPFNLAWSRDGIPNGLNASDCIQWKFDDYRTKNNYLCQIYEPSYTSDFQYFYNETISSGEFHHCLNLIGSDVDGVSKAWRDNKFCVKKACGMRWSNEMISGMNCDYITLNEKRNVRAYFCTPEWWGYRLEVYFGGTSSRGNEECIDIEEPEDGDFVPVSICKAKACPRLSCTGDCPAGFVYNKEGCKMCKCKPDHCAFANCPELRCREYEYINDGCCATCKRSPPQWFTKGCPRLTECSLRCSYGYATDSAGCDTCTCRTNPCLFHRCDFTEECRVNHVTFAPYCVAMKERGTSECGPTERFTLRSIPCWGDRCNPIGICEKEKCGNWSCKKSCHGGFYMNLTPSSQFGCRTCDCKPDHCAAIECPELPACDELVYVGHACCPVCKQQRCSQIRCDVECANGYELDEFGCQSCKCKKVECDMTKCRSLNCRNPIELRGLCCPYCPPEYSTNGQTPPMQCPRLSCPNCEGGSYKDYIGCDTCRCKPDFCKSIMCPTLACGTNFKPVYKEGSCCPICTSKYTCPQLSCNNACPGGYEFNVHGCMTCTCKPRTCATTTCEKPTLCENPIEIRGKCCPVCPKAEPKVMGKCGYVNKFWNFDEGKWVNDPRGATIDCEMTESDVLDLCRSVYPDILFSGAKKQDAKYRTFNNWCYHGDNECAKALGTFEWTCTTMFSNTIRDMKFFGLDNDLSSTYPCFSKDVENRLCFSTPIPWIFSRTGRVSGMKCAPVREPNDPIFDWTNSFVCVPKSAARTFNFFHDGVPADVSMGQCIATPLEVKGKIHEGWTNNYLCMNDKNFVCDKACGGRYEMDVSGNPICECAKDPCSDVRCGEFQECKWNALTEKAFCEDTCTNNGKCDVTERCEKAFDASKKSMIATCKPRCTTFDTCSLECPSGYQTDSNGCRKCACRPNKCTNVKCPTPTCRNPVLPDGECCPACPAKCRCSKLTKFCRAGYEVDPEFGCFLDECKPERCLTVTCPPVTCNETVLPRGDCCLRCVDRDACPLRKCVPCKNGYVVDRLGCRTCECRPNSCRGVNCPMLTCEHQVTRPGDCCPTCIGRADNVICPHHLCNSFCANGFEMDVNGCPTCNCKPEECTSKNSCEKVSGDCELDDAVSVWGKCGLRCPMKGFQCPTLPCDNPVYFGSEICPRCPARCPIVRCTIDCGATGYKYVNGCMTCECKPSECAQQNCSTLKDCEYLIWTENDPCCPKCQETYCSNVKCPRTCNVGFELVKIRGQCCRQCMRTRTPTPYVCPAVYQCTKACPGGYKTDWYGCPTCECKPSNCKKLQCPALLGCNYGYNVGDECCLTCPATKKKSFTCPQLPCANPIRFGDELCPRCPARCSPIRCKTRCAIGYKYDTDGCMTCECRSASCAMRTCPKLNDNCKYVIWTTEDECCPKCKETYCSGVTGCPTSCPDGEELVTIQGQCCRRCMATRTPFPYVCPATRQCTMPCPGGYKLDLLGCPTCECKPDACKSVRCSTQFSCDYPYSYNSACCLTCPPADAETKPMCNELRCENPTFIEGHMCPTCPMKPYFPDDFVFMPTFAPKKYCNWHSIKLDWDFAYEPSFIKTRFPVSIKVTRNRFVDGMRCTPVGYMNEIATYFLCLPRDSDIRLRFYRDAKERLPEHGRCLRIEHPLIESGYLCQVDDVIDASYDLVWTHNGAEFFQERRWSCVGIAPSTTSGIDGWDNNYVCSRYDVGFRWSNAGRIDGMTCTHVDAWDDESYFCVPNGFEYDVTWRSRRSDRGTCLKWTEPEQKDWNEKYLCFHKKICKTRSRELFCPIGFTARLDEDGCPSIGCRQNETSVPFGCDKKCVIGYKRTADMKMTCDCISVDVDPVESCSKTCLNGYEYSPETGSRLCKCKPDRCTPNQMTMRWNEAKKTCDYPITRKGECDYECPETFNIGRFCTSGTCPTLNCPNPVQIKGRCCPVCPNACPQIKCTKDCPNGFGTDVHGCRRCHCQGAEVVKPICPEVACSNECVGGYKVDSNGCDTCRCKPDACASVTCSPVKCSKPVHKSGSCCPRCPKVTNEHCRTTLCKTACPTGFEFDVHGCMTCKCKPDHCDRSMEQSCSKNMTMPTKTCLKLVNVVGECRSYCAEEEEEKENKGKTTCPNEKRRSMGVEDGLRYWGCDGDEFQREKMVHGDTRCSTCDATTPGWRQYAKGEEMSPGMLGGR